MWLNRTRLLSREHHQNLLDDSEADGLLIAPLRRLAELLGEVAKVDRRQRVRERLSGFVNALSSCPLGLAAVVVVVIAARATRAARAARTPAAAGLL